MGIRIVPDENLIGTISDSFDGSVHYINVNPLSAQFGDDTVLSVQRTPGKTIKNNSSECILEVGEPSDFSIYSRELKPGEEMSVTSTPGSVSYVSVRAMNYGAVITPPAQVIN